MADRPNVLIVYGYHPEEEFGIEVGRYLQRLFEEKPMANVSLKKYDGINPRTVDDVIPDSNSRGRLLHQYVSKLGNVDYLIDLHDECPWPKNAEERKQLLEKLPPFKRNKHGRVSGIPGQIMDYVSKFQIPDELKKELITYCLSKEPDYVAAAFFVPEEAYLPIKYDHLEIAYYPHLSSIESASSFIQGLIPIIQKNELSMNRRLQNY